MNLIYLMNFFPGFMEYKNIDKVYFRIYKIDKFEFDKYYTFSDVKDYLIKTPVDEFSFDLPENDDYQQHSVEFKINSLKKGRSK